MRTKLLIALMIFASLLLVGCAASTVQARAAETNLSLPVQEPMTEQVRHSLVIKYSIANDLVMIQIVNVDAQGSARWQLSINDKENGIANLASSGDHIIRTAIGRNIVAFSW